MAISKAKARSVKHAVLAGEEQITDTLDGTTTVAIVELTGPATKVTVQTSDTLAVTVEYSCDGKTFFGSTAAAVGVPVTQSAHVVGVLRITRTAGIGRAVILGA